MTRDKAIEVLAAYKMESAFSTTPEFVTALKLGIEALAYCNLVSNGLPLDELPPLPGETQE